MEQNHGRMTVKGGKYSGIGKTHKFIVHAEHTESRKDYDYDSPMAISSEKSRKPKKIIRHEFTIRKVESPKDSALKKRTK